MMETMIKGIREWYAQAAAWWRVFTQARVIIERQALKTVASLPEVEAIERKEKKATESAGTTARQRKNNAKKEAVPTRVGEVLCQVEAFLKKRYLFRYNQLNETTEFRRSNNPEGRFRAVEKRELNSLCIAARKSGIDCWDRDISRYVYSEDIPSYHPIRAYIEALPPWDGADRVRPLARRVAESDLWLHGFHLWLRGMVAQWMGFNPTYGNSVAPVLVSRQQGMHKSTFCRMLLPEALQGYYTDSFKLNSEQHAERKLGCFALINLDEMDQLSDQKMAVLKNLMQMAGLAIRKAHKSTHSALPRMASLIATSNRKDLLSDPTGSRRFLCVEVNERIALHPIAHEQLYAQLKEEVLSGERYWFSTEEEKTLQKHNRIFQRRNMAEELFWKHFRLPQTGESGDLYSASEIFLILKKKSPAIMREVSASCFGKVLIGLGLERIHTKRGNVYPAIAL